MVNDGVNIVIPTYNRAESLHKTLLFLCKSLEGLENINVIVIDNSSTDGTKKILSSMKNIFDESGLAFNYKINKRNIGLDGSILYAAKNILSNKRFTWFLSDDDFLLDEGVKTFVETLMTSRKKMEIAQFINPQYRHQKIDKFLRASFLPSVALRGRAQFIGDINKLQGLNYLHLAVINSIVKKKNEIGESKSIVGIQIPNLSFRFKFFQTFIVGYSMCFLFNNDVMSKKKALEEAMNRAQHYSALALLDYASDCNFIRWSPTFGHIRTIYELFGIKAYKIYIMIFLKKIPQKIVRFILFKKVNQYLDSAIEKRKIINKYE